MRSIIAIIMKTRKLQVLAIALLAVAAVDAAFYLLAVSPASSGKAALQARLAELKGGISEQEKMYGRYLAYERGLDEIKRFKDLLPPRARFTEIIREVYDLAKKDGMKSTSFGTETRDIQQTGELAQINFSMPVSGSYRDVRKFIYDVENSDLFLNIDNLGLRKGSQTEDITLTISLSTYMRS